MENNIEEKIVEQYMQDYIQNDQLVKCVKRGQMTYEDARALVVNKKALRGES